MIALFGLPAPVSFLQGDVLFARYSVANNFIPRSSDNEFLLLDGETVRLEVGLFHQINEQWSMELLIPFIHHSGGKLDAFVDDWHQVFDLPASGRPNAPSDRLLYRYSVDGDRLLDYTLNASGPGDLQMAALYKLGAGFVDKSLLRVGIKLPTGNPDKLFGSGGFDVYADINHRFLLADSKLSLAGMAGMLVMQQSDIFPNQRTFVAYASTSLSLQANKKITLDLQLLAHTGFFKSELKVLADTSLQLVFGGRVGLSESLEMQFAMSEDPVYGTSPDVVFHLGLRNRF